MLSCKNVIETRHEKYYVYVMSTWRILNFQKNILPNRNFFASSWKILKERLKATFSWSSSGLSSTLPEKNQSVREREREGAEAGDGGSVMVGQNVRNACEK